MGGIDSDSDSDGEVGLSLSAETIAALRNYDDKHVNEEANISRHLPYFEQASTIKIEG